MGVEQPQLEIEGTQKMEAVVLVGPSSSHLCGDAEPMAMSDVGHVRGEYKLHAGLGQESPVQRKPKLALDS